MSEQKADYIKYVKSKIALIILLVALLIVPVPHVSALSAGVSPPNVTINNATSNGTYTVTFAVYNMGNETTDYSLTASGNISNWITLETEKATVSGKKSYPTQAEINIPDNIPDGTYSGNILIKTIPDAGTTGNKVSIGVNLPIEITVLNLNPDWTIYTIGLIIIILIMGIWVIRKKL